ncbi:Gfo/Idh/MocA family oxidoreductase [Mycolicibacterium sp.]|uniref:Gfo/Idh/MocA family protein n=1 Tax=Mycolicibacterium sp. TaxID=2320850 RepID=UPI001A3056BD|nr:Gfo/Idh/MocA family oxidoreductase [Mycolicibacterium sp.]MBJ7338962.1 Gfo/Idh/MocA family oxidoreductase [Mycolicibacterium sp.]
MTRHLPSPRTCDPLDAPTLRWGIMGPGGIARQFTATLQKYTAQKVAAVGSRSQVRADEFAARWSVPAAHGSYRELLANAEVDIVYVATPHTEHHACALAALAAGKHVLVEKPMGVNAAQASEIAESARRAGLFAGEAMWMKFLPRFDVIRQIIDDGILGRIHTVIADHGEYFTTDHRIYDPSLAGGPLLDLGTYPVSLAHFVFGAPESVLASGQLANRDLNGQISAILSHAGGNQASLHTTILGDTPSMAVIAGDEATLTLPGVFYRPGPFAVSFHGGTSLAFDEECVTDGFGLHFSAVEAARVIADGGVESAVHPLSAATTTLATMDEIRRQLGIVFPGD